MQTSRVMISLTFMVSSWVAVRARTDRSPARPRRCSVGSGVTAVVSVEPDIGVELAAAAIDLGIVAQQLGLGPIDDADEALQPGLAAGGGAGRAGPSADRAGSAAWPAVVATGARSCPRARADPLHLHRRRPSRSPRRPCRCGCRSRSGRPASPKRSRHSWPMLSSLADAAHLGEARVADVGVVRPDHRLGARAAWPRAGARSVSNMWRVAQVPALGAAVVHDAVVALGGGDQPRVLGGVEEAARRRRPA